MNDWKLVADDPPPAYHNVLLAFADHWNQVVGFYCGEGRWFETSAHDHNTEIKGDPPKWWATIQEVPHRRITK